MVEEFIVKKFGVETLGWKVFVRHFLQANMQKSLQTQFNIIFLVLMLWQLFEDKKQTFHCACMLGFQEIMKNLWCQSERILWFTSVQENLSNQEIPSTENVINIYRYQHSTGNLLLRQTIRILAHYFLHLIQEWSLTLALNYPVLTSFHKSTKHTQMTGYHTLKTEFKKQFRQRSFRGLKKPRYIWNMT